MNFNVKIITNLGILVQIFFKIIHLRNPVNSQIAKTF